MGTEETCGRKVETGRMKGGGGGEEDVKLSPSFTTLSTIAIQAGQSQLVISVLRSGSLFHLQLVQAHPGLCEIGWNQEENHKLIQEQQQLIHKLQKHKREALSLVRSSRQTQQRREEEELELTKEEEELELTKEEEEMELKEAMEASLSEGWSLLLHLLHRRQEVLMMALDFHQRALELDVSISKLENLQVRPDDVRLTELRFRFDSMRKEVLLKSLQVLNSSEVLLHGLRQLQSTEALQRRGAVLQDRQGAGGAEEQSSQSSQEVALRLEELVEELQDRRRRADQAVRLQLQEAEKSITVQKTESGSDDWTLILDQNLESESTPAEGAHLQSHSSTEESRNLEPESRSDIQSGSRSDPMSGFRSEPTTGPRLEEITNLQSRFRSNLRTGSRSDMKSDSKSAAIRDLQPESRLVQMIGKLESGFRSELTSRPRLERDTDLQTESSSEETLELHLGSRSESRSDLRPGSRSDKTMNLQTGSRSDLQANSRSVETRNIVSLSTLDVNPRSRLDLKTESRSETKDLLNVVLRSRLEKISESRSILMDHKDPLSGSISNEEAGSGSNIKPESRSDPKHRIKLDMKCGAPSEQTRDLKSEARSDIQSGSISNLQAGFRSEPQCASSLEEIRNQQSKFRFNTVTGSRSDMKSDSESEQPESRLDHMFGSGSEKARDVDPGFRSEESRKFELGSRSELHTDFPSEENRGYESGSRSDKNPRFRLKLKAESRSGETRDLQPGSRLEKPGPGSDFEFSRKQNEKKQETKTKSGRVQSAVVKEQHSGEDHTHLVLLTNQQQEVLSSCEHLLDKVCSWVQQSSSVLSRSSEAGLNLTEAEDALNTHKQLHTQAESVCQDAENLKQILDQVRGAGPGQLTPLRALTEQLKRGRASRAAGPPRQDLTARAHVVLTQLQSLNRTIQIDLQLLQDHVSFLRAAQQLQEEIEEVREVYRSRGEERSTPQKKKLDARWEETLTRLLAAQEVGTSCVQILTMASDSGLDLRSVASVVQRTIKQLNRTKQEVNELRSRHHVQIHQQEEEVTSRRKYRERLLKTLQDLRSVSELLDSCTNVDLGSHLQTSTLTERFIQATPLFTQLDAEVEQVMRSRESLGGDQEVEQVTRSWESLGRHQEVEQVTRSRESLGGHQEVEQMMRSRESLGGDQEVEQVTRSWESLGGHQEVEQVTRSRESLGGHQEVEQVKEDDVSELLTLQKKVKEKMEQSEWILGLSSSFHLRAQQLEALLLSDSAGSLKKQQLIKSLFTTAAALKTNICTAAAQCDWAGFKLQQLELRFLSLDSLCVSWLNQPPRREEELHREHVTRQINDDITQLRDSFKELKKRFNNLKFNFLKRNDRSRSMKAVRNQLQQVELYEDKLQSLLRKHLQGVRAQLGSEGVAREVEDAVNELQRQMGEFERSYQFWCEEASATITRVQMLSSDCRSTEAVTVLHRQFEKFVWPTVAQQEERISQISDLAVRLHGVEEGRLYIERTLSKHSTMVASIRKLSDGLMELEATLKLKQLKPEKQQQKNGEKEIKEEEKEWTRQNEKQEQATEKKTRENRKIEMKEQADNYRSQEAADGCELKETGHTPDLTGEHDGKEVPVKRQTAANRKPPLQKSDNQEADRQTVTTEISHREQSGSSSFCSTHSFSLSCSPEEARRRVGAILSQLQPIATEAQTTPPHPVIGPSLSDVQRECHRTEVQDSSDLSEVELHQQEVMTEDSLSNDEYECVSPDDISLPPLADTPESGLVQSDFEEGFCFSSHSSHINQHSLHHQAQSEQSGVVRQQRGSSQTEGYPPPPTNHSNPRLRSESSSFVQSPLTVPDPGFLTIMQTEETSVDYLHGSTEAQFISRSNQVQESRTTDTDVPERRSPSETEPLLNDLNSQLNQPQQCTGTQSNGNQKVTSKSKTLPQTDHIAHPTEIDQIPTLQSSCPQPFNGPDTDIKKDTTCPQDTGFLNCRTFPQVTTICQDNRFTQSFPNSGICLDQDTNSSQTRRETSLVSTPQSNSLTSTVTKQNVFFKFSPLDPFPPARGSHSSPHKSSLSQNKTLSKNNLIPRTRGSTQSNDRTLPAAFRTCSQTSTSLLQHGNPPQSFPDSRSGLDQSKPSTQPSKEPSSVKMPQSSSLTTTTTVTQQSVHYQSSSKEGESHVPPAGITLRLKQDDPPDVHVPTVPEPDSVNNITISSSNRFSNKQSHHTVYSIHESSKQCVHDPGMSPSSAAKPTAPPQPQTKAQQANPHVTPPSSPSHLLTSDQDPDICQPMAIREEIRLTPQIQGPPLPAPSPPQTQAGSLPQGKASKPGPPCFTRPLSRATVKEGSPVTLEVEVTGQEPTLTWSEDGDASPGRALLHDDGRHFLFIPDVSDSDGGLQDAVQHPDSQQTAGDKWLVAEVFDLIRVDWQTWFGTLCVLLWLLYLILL
ncbi:trichohyalin isoform X2 [Platichthys flesus]|uniref:trichohyalin isoform X2 n=1 Tax=Platichthys flesus TaxID=8260 RepID=UPI002DBB83A1|nr:trichohyalin isoform X2 [Platichthys flesus]